MTTSQRPHPEQDRETLWSMRARTIPVAPTREEGNPSEGENPKRSCLGLVLLRSAVLTCPCHFPLIVLLAPGGTALGLLGWVVVFLWVRAFPRQKVPSQL